MFLTKRRVHRSWSLTSKMINLPVETKNNDSVEWNRPIFRRREANKKQRAQWWLVGGAFAFVCATAYLCVVLHATWSVASSPTFWNSKNIPRYLFLRRTRHKEGEFVTGNWARTTKKHSICRNCLEKSSEDVSFEEKERRVRSTHVEWPFRGGTFNVVKDTNTIILSVDCEKTWSVYYISAKAIVAWYGNMELYT